MTHHESVTSKKAFLTQLKRIAAAGIQVEKNALNSHRFKLNKNFAIKYRKHLENGDPIHLAEKHAMTTKVSNPKKAASKMSKAKKSKTAKGKDQLRKSKAKADSKAKKTKAAAARLSKGKKDGKKSKLSKAKSGADKKARKDSKAKKGSS